MDAQTFFETVASKLPTGLPLPGNSAGTTQIFGLVGDTAVKIGNASDSAWSSFMSGAESVVTAPYRVVHGAYEEVKGAAHRTGELLSAAQESTAQAAHGFASWTKWVVVGLIALAVIYVLSFVPRGGR